VIAHEALIIGGAILAAAIGVMNETRRRKKWLHNFGRCDRWNLCLTARTVVRANQERQ
jgi:hypothetical protein